MRQNHSHQVKSAFHSPHKNISLYSNIQPNGQHCTKNNNNCFSNGNITPNNLRFLKNGFSAHNSPQQMTYQQRAQQQQQYYSNQNSANKNKVHRQQNHSTSMSFLQDSQASWHHQSDFSFKRGQSPTGQQKQTCSRPRCHQQSIQELHHPQDLMLGGPQTPLKRGDSAGNSYQKKGLQRRMSAQNSFQTIPMNGQQNWQTDQHMVGESALKQGFKVHQQMILESNREYDFQVSTQTEDISSVAQESQQVQTIVAQVQEPQVCSSLEQQIKELVAQVKRLEQMQDEKFNTLLKNQQQTQQHSLKPQVPTLQLSRQPSISQVTNEQLTKRSSISEKRSRPIVNLNLKEVIEQKLNEQNQQSQVSQQRIEDEVIINIESPKIELQTARQSVAPLSQFLLPPKRECDSGKKTLILDLDETLIHSSFEPLAHADIILDLQLEQPSPRPHQPALTQVYVVKRPFCEDLITRASEWYEVVLFTASIAEYAEPLYQRIDKNKITAAHLYRKHCTFENGLYVKDLSKLGRPLSDLILIDNSPLSSLFQPENSLPCTSWYEDKNDRELLYLLPILEKLAKVPDVRAIIPLLKDQEGDQILFEKARDLLGIPEPSVGSVHKGNSNLSRINSKKSLLNQNNTALSGQHNFQTPGFQEQQIQTLDDQLMMPHQFNQLIQQSVTQNNIQSIKEVEYQPSRYFQDKAINTSQRQLFTPHVPIQSFENEEKQLRNQLSVSLEQNQSLSTIQHNNTDQRQYYSMIEDSDKRVLFENERPQQSQRHENPYQGQLPNMMLRHPSTPIIQQQHPNLSVITEINQEDYNQKPIPRQIQRPQCIVPKLNFDNQNFTQKGVVEHRNLALQRQGTSFQIIPEQRYDHLQPQVEQYATLQASNMQNHSGLQNSNHISKSQEQIRTIKDFDFRTLEKQRQPLYQLIGHKNPKARSCEKQIIQQSSAKNNNAPQQFHNQGQLLGSPAGQTAKFNSAFMNYRETPTVSSISKPTHTPVKNEYYNNLESSIQQIPSQNYIEERQTSTPTIIYDKNYDHKEFNRQQPCNQVVNSNTVRQLAFPSPQMYPALQTNTVMHCQNLQIIQDNSRRTKEIERGQRHSASIMNNENQIVTKSNYIQNVVDKKDPQSTILAARLETLSQQNIDPHLISNTQNKKPHERRLSQPNVFNYEEQQKQPQQMINNQYYIEAQKQELQPLQEISIQTGNIANQLIQNNVPQRAKPPQQQLILELGPPHTQQNQGHHRNLTQFVPNIVSPPNLEYSDSSTCSLQNASFQEQPWGSIPCTPMSQKPLPSQSFQQLQHSQYGQFQARPEFNQNSSRQMVVESQQQQCIQMKPMNNANTAFYEISNQPFKISLPDTNNQHHYNITAQTGIQHQQQQQQYHQSQRRCSSMTNSVVASPVHCLGKLMQVQPNVVTYSRQY